MSFHSSHSDRPAAVLAAEVTALCALQLPQVAPSLCNAAPAQSVPGTGIKCGLAQYLRGRWAIASRFSAAGDGVGVGISGGGALPSH